jgi:hypothetical protein
MGGSSFVQAHRCRQHVRRIDGSVAWGTVRAMYSEPSEQLGLQWDGGSIERCRLPERSDQLIDAIRRLPEVQSLDLSYTSVNDDDIAALISCPGLIEVDISGCEDLTTGCLHHLSQMPFLNRSMRILRIGSHSMTSCNSLLQSV